MYFNLFFKLNWKDLMCGNTHPKLLEVSHWKTSNTTKAFICSMRNTAHTDNVHTTMALPQREMKTEQENNIGRQRCRQTKTEVDEDGDIQMQREMHSGVEQSCSPPSADDYPKKKMDALCGREKQQLPFSWRLPQSDEDGGRWKRRRTHSGVEESGSSLSADDFPRVTKTELDTSPPTWLADSRAHGGCSSLCSP